MANQAENKGRIVIGIDDLEPDQPQSYVGYESQLETPYSHAGQSYSASNTKNYSLGGSQIKLGLVTGLFGGFAAWVVSDLFFVSYSILQQSNTGAYIFSAIWVGIVGCFIGVGLGASEGISSGSRAKAVSGGLIGGAIGCVGAILSGFVAVYIYTFMIQGVAHTDMTRRVLARAVSWSVAGLGIGLAQGLPGLHSKKIINGMVGGLICGAAGGSWYDLILSTSSSDSLALTRMLGVTAMGIFIGGAIALVEEVRKEAWLQVIGGPLVGKQFILYGTLTRIGRSLNCEITLVRDLAVCPEHARIVFVSGRYRLEPIPGMMVQVNGQTVSGKTLRGGDTIQIASWTMVFEEKSVSPLAQ